MAKSSYTPKPADVHAANLGILKHRIKEKNLSGAYVFYGEEEYTKNFYYSELVKACGNKALNVKTHYAEVFTMELRRAVVHSVQEMTQWMQVQQHHFTQHLSMQHRV